MSEQLSFWGYDEDGQLVSTGKRLVYFVECREQIKIGFTTRDVRERIKEFETGNPDECKLIGAIAVPEGRDDRFFHQQFATFRRRGEWFLKTPELMRGIDHLLQAESSTRAKIAPEIVEINVSEIPIGQQFVWNATCPTCKEWAAVVGVLSRLGGSDPTTGTVYHQKCNSRFRVSFVAT